MNELMISFLIYLVLILCVLVSVAFLTLFERKILGYIQIRKGPNKVGFMGLLQPFSDAIKLFSKEQIVPFMSNFFIYYFAPLFLIMISLLMWIGMPYFFYFINFNFSILYIFCLSSMSVYGVMLSGWSSNSNYSLLGSLRSIAQTISYEISLIIMIMSFLIFINSFEILFFFKYQSFSWFMFFMFPLSLMLIVSLLAETNRTPFDLAEGESELVSGFNVEYSSGSFALIFLAEYSSIIFMSFLYSMLILGGDFMKFSFFLKMIFVSFSWIWIRGTYPRMRYDKLMELTWTSYLPVSLMFLILNFNILLVLGLI